VEAKLAELTAQAKEKEEQVARRAEEKVLKRAESESAKLIAEAKAKAEWEAAQIIAEARKQAEEVIAEADRQLEEAPAPPVRIAAEARPAPGEFTTPLAGAVPVSDPLDRLARESLESQVELNPLPSATVPEIQPAAEPTEHKPEAKAKGKAAASNGDGNGLYRGTLELDITSVDAQQIPVFLSQLQQIPNLQVVSFKGLPGGNSIIVLSINHPMPLPDILKRMSPVESAEGKDNGVNVVLKAMTL
jgi:vacuolar-type H+-ATPase subunit H